MEGALAGAVAKNLRRVLNAIAGKSLPAKARTGGALSYVMLNHVLSSCIERLGENKDEGVKYEIESLLG